MRKKWAMFFKNLRKMFNGNVVVMPSFPPGEWRNYGSTNIPDSGSPGFTVTTSPKMPPTVGGVASTERK